MKNNCNFYYVFIFIVLFFISCEDQAIDTGEKQFNIELFEQNIVDSLTGQVPGFAYAINQNQVLYNDDAWGYIDLDNQIPFTPDTRIHVASISKTITAVAVLQILEDLPDVTVDSLVWDYLPGYWWKGQGIDKLTFRHLLTHTSGLTYPGGPNNFVDLHAVIAAGLDENLLGGGTEYSNKNYAMFRVIIPILSGAFTNEVTSSDTTAMAYSYIDYVNNKLFRPMGIGRAYCLKQSTEKMRYYDCDNTSESSGGTLDMTFSCGGYGWHLSAFELAAFNAHLRYNDDIISSETRDEMDSGILGWNNNHSSANGEYGTYLYHSGQWHNGSKGLETIIMKFPNRNVEAAVVYNCVDHSNPNIRSPRKFLKGAYDSAWE